LIERQVGDRRNAVGGSVIDPNEIPFSKQPASEYDLPEETFNFVGGFGLEDRFPGTGEHAGGIARIQQQGA
jgi:hypothetical protein